jgi:hypothetical protein
MRDSRQAVDAVGGHVRVSGVTEMDTIRSTDVIQEYHSRVGVAGGGAGCCNAEVSYSDIRKNNDGLDETVSQD